MGADIKIGVSACLLGEHVRYDGGHKHDRYITDNLGRYFSFVPVCPEVECGLSVPRDSMRLEGDLSEPRLVISKTGVDCTERMLDYCSGKVTGLLQEGLCGFILKKNSPSCGLYRVKVYKGNSAPLSGGRGVFACVLARSFPLLPMEEEGRLNDPEIRENFLERVFSFKRWKDFLAGSPDIGGVVEFHTTHKLLMMAHSPVIYREMGRLVALGRELQLSELLSQYELLFMKGLGMHATVAKNTNVLQHMMGYFKKQLSSDEKAELLEVIGDYHGRLTPLVVPVTMFRHYVRKYGQPYLKSQVYLSPHPAELMLRNHV